MTDAEIDTRCGEIMAEIRAMAQTARRSLGQRFRHLRAESDARFEALFLRYGHSLARRVARR